MLNKTDIAKVNDALGDEGSLSTSKSRTEEHTEVIYNNTVPGAFYKGDWWSALGRLVPAREITPERMQAEKQVKRRDAIASVLFSSGGKN